MLKPRSSARLCRSAARALALTTLLTLFPLINSHAAFTAPGATQNSVTLTWTAPGDDGNVGTASQYDIRFSTSPINDSNWDEAIQVTGEPTPQPAGSAESFTIAGLDSSTTYYFAIKAADEVPNWSGLSNIVTVTTTGDETPPAEIDDLQASSGEDTGEIDLVWTAPGDDGITGTAASYEIRYSLGEITDGNFNSATLCGSPPTPLAGGEGQSYTLCDLSAGDMYYIAMKTYDDEGNLSPISNVDSAVAYYSIISDVEDDPAGLPDNFRLNQNYPNPFNPTTEIRFALPESRYIELSIYNAVGHKVVTLVDRQMPPGEHVVQWNGTSDSGQNVATGVYFYRLLAEDFSDSKKMVLLK